MCSGGNMGHMHGCCHGWGFGPGRILIRILLTLLVLFVVFWFGVKVGELKAGYGFGGYGQTRMMRTGSPLMLYQGQGMMQPQGGNMMYQIPTTTTVSK